MERLKVLEALVLGAALLAPGSATVAMAADSPFFGRWAFFEEPDEASKGTILSSKGKLYKTIDVAPCGADFCGVSVGENGACGPVLFRLLTIHAKNEDLKGHGLWGNVKKEIRIHDLGEVDGGAPHLHISLGEDGFDVTGREGSIPTFMANYAREGEVQCKAGGIKTSELLPVWNPDNLHLGGAS